MCTNSACNHNSRVAETENSLVQMLRRISCRHLLTFSTIKLATKADTNRIVPSVGTEAKSPVPEWAGKGLQQRKMEDCIGHGKDSSYKPLGSILTGEIEVRCDRYCAATVPRGTLWF